MKRILCIGLFLGVSFLASAQDDSISAYSKGTHALFLYTSAGFNSTGLTNEFIYDFYKGEFLTRDLRNRVSDRLKDRNRAGFLLEAGLNYSWSPPDTADKFGYYLSVEEKSMAEIQFRKGFFDLLFFGNAPYTGETIMLDGMEVNMMTWQKYSAGITKRIRKGDQEHYFSCGLGFIVGQQHLAVNVHEGSFFTQQDAEYVSLDVNMDVYHTDSNRTGFGAYNGYGIAYDLGYHYWSGKHHLIAVQLKDLGFIRWDRQPDRFTRDTTFRFDGFEVDLLNFNSPALSNVGDSLLDEWIGPKGKSDYLTELPIDVSASYTYFFNSNRFFLSAAARCRFHSLYRPYVALSGGYDGKFKKWSLEVEPGVSYGGYGNFNAGLQLTAGIKKTFILLGFSGVDALVAPRSRCGLSGYLTLYQRF